MAKRKKTIKKTIVKQSLSDSIRKRLKKLPDKSRSYLDPKTGSVYSRRQFEKGRKKIPRRNAPQIKRKYQQYLQLRDSYIEKQAQNGKKLTKREAMQSEKLKKVIKKLRSKKPQDKKWALEQTIRGDKVSDWTPYLKRWSEGNL